MISNFVADNIVNLLLLLNSFESGNYEQALIESFVKFDELLKAEKINNFLKREYTKKLKEKNIKKELKDDYLIKKDNKSENSYNKETEETIIFELDKNLLMNNKDYNSIKEKSKELKSIENNSLKLDIKDLLFEINKILNSPEKSNSLSSNNINNLVYQKEFLDCLNLTLEENDAEKKELESKY
jgi:hypothetical protein